MDSPSVSPVSLTRNKEFIGILRSTSSIFLNVIVPSIRPSKMNVFWFIYSAMRAIALIWSHSSNKRCNPTIPRVEFTNFIKFPGNHGYRCDQNEASSIQKGRSENVFATSTFAFINISKFSSCSSGREIERGTKLRAISDWVANPIYSSTFFWFPVMRRMEYILTEKRI